MADEKQLLTKLQDVYGRCNLMTQGELIGALESLIDYYHLGAYYSSLYSYKDDYSRMMHYMKEGFEDNMRSRLYQQNQHGLIVMLRDIMHKAKAAVVPTLTKACENSKDFDFTNAEQCLLAHSQDVSIAQLSGDEAVRNAYNAQYSYRQSLFNAIISAGPMGQNEAFCLQNILLNENLEEVDILLVVSALMLAQQFCFDPVRFRLLLLVLSKTGNEEIRQRVLVSVAFALPSETEIRLYPELRKEFLAAISAYDLMKAFVNLQTQVLYSVTATDDMQKMNKDIMPSIMDEMKRQNLANPDNSSLDDILHPDHDEKAMEVLEEKLNKMRKMQEKGSDMLFGGFSAMKRYGFFYTLMNWFCPYSANHPEVAKIAKDATMQKLFESIESATQLCDSDKYSMVFGLNHVFGSLPPQLKEMLQSGEAKIGLLDEEIANDANYRRRMYLQSLYRFYNLYSNKNDFCNPFARPDKWCFLLHPYLVDKAQETNSLVNLAHQLLQKNRINEAMVVLLADKSHEGTLDHLVLLGTCHYRQHRFSEAIDCYQQALFLDADNQRLRLRLGKIALESHKWTMALQAFREIRLHFPDSYTTDVQLNLAEALLHLNRIEEVRDVILPFDFMEEQTQLMLRLLGWYYLLSGSPEKALACYSRISDDDRLTEDYFHLTFVHLCLDDNSSAVMSLQSLFRRQDSAVIIAENIPVHDSADCTNYLALANITQEEWSILIDLAKVRGVGKYE